MAADVFISYAWGDPENTAHREWVRLLAANLKALGYDVLFDANVAYGDSLSGFMQRSTEARHVLMIVDEQYVHRADNVPGSGVAIENGWFQQEVTNKPSTWLAALFKDNPNCCLPGWLKVVNPKAFNFNYNGPTGSPGSEQITELWRWIEGLPANQDHLVSPATLRARAKRLENVSVERDPSKWRTPGLSGEVEYNYLHAPGTTFYFGYGELSFGFMITACGPDSVYVYADPIDAVGINRIHTFDLEQVARQISPSRTVTASVGDQVVLQNKVGALCLVDILDVQHENSQQDHVPASISISFQILTES